MASANNAKKGANVRMKRKERKNIAAGQAHIQSTFNNTVVTITDLQGNAVSWCSSGSLNFRVTIGALAGEIANGAKSGGMSPENITEIADWEDAKSAADAIKSIICDGDTVLIKASRALSLERISKLLQE